MKKAIAILIALAVFPAFASDPAPTPDGPLNEKEPELCLPLSDAQLLAQHIKRSDAENAQLKKDATLPIWIPIVVGIVAVGAGVSVGVAVGRATK